MTDSLPPPAGLHLQAALIAMILFALELAGALSWARRLEMNSMHAIAPTSFAQKDQGLAWQRAAARTPDVLPLYGSSELAKIIPDKASLFFAHAPTGFVVSPIGKVGMTSLPMLQRIGAIGPDLRGKKIAISISPSWFFSDVIYPHYYEGNFSVLAASKLIFGTHASLSFKQDLARRMQLFPATFAKGPLLGRAADYLASGSAFGRAAYFALWPLGQLQTTILEWQDDYESVLPLMQSPPPAWTPQPAAPDWPALLTDAKNYVVVERPDKSGLDFDKKPFNNGGKAGFEARVKIAHEWIDFELLLRILSELHAQPLLLSMPINGAYYDRGGISRTAREAYYQRMRGLAAQYHFPLLEFVDRDEDPLFLDGHHDHLGSEGWMVYNRILDDFFHDRPLHE